MHVDDVVRRTVQRESIELTSGCETARVVSQRLVGTLDRLANSIARVSPLLGHVGEVIEPVGHCAARAVPVHRGELVERGDPLDVGRDDPVVVDALVGHQQRPSLGLGEHGHRAQVVTDRLVDESFSVHVEEHSVLAVVQRQLDEQHRVVEGDAVRNKVTVEAGVILAEDAARAQSETEPVADAPRVRPKRHATLLGRGSAPPSVHDRPGIRRWRAAWTAS